MITSVAVVVLQRPMRPGPGPVPARHGRCHRSRGVRGGGGGCCARIQETRSAEPQKEEHVLDAIPGAERQWRCRVSSRRRAKEFPTPCSSSGVSSRPVRRCSPASRARPRARSPSSTRSPANPRGGTGPAAPAPGRRCPGEFEDRCNQAGGRRPAVDHVDAPLLGLLAALVSQLGTRIADFPATAGRTSRRYALARHVLINRVGTATVGPRGCGDATAHELLQRSSAFAPDDVEVTNEASSSDSARSPRRNSRRGRHFHDHVTPQRWSAPAAR